MKHSFACEKLFTGREAIDDTGRVCSKYSEAKRCTTCQAYANQHLLLRMRRPPWRWVYADKVRKTVKGRKGESIHLCLYRQHRKVIRLYHRVTGGNRVDIASCRFFCLVENMRAHAPICLQVRGVVRRDYYLQDHRARPLMQDSQLTCSAECFYFSDQRATGTVTV